MPTTNDTVSEIAEIRKSVAAIEKTQRQALIDKGTAEARLAELTKTLHSLTGSKKWSSLQEAIINAGEAAQAAVQALQKALEEAGIDAE